MKKQDVHRLDILPGKEYSFDRLSFRCFETSHDAERSIGFHLTLEAWSLPSSPIRGVVSDEMVDLAARSDYLFLESNYSPELLIRDPIRNS